MLSVKASLCGYFLIAIINYYGDVNAQLQCYVCKGCEDVADMELQTCSPTVIDPPEGSGGETDSNESDSGIESPGNPAPDPDETNSDSDEESEGSGDTDTGDTNPDNIGLDDDDENQDGTNSVYRVQPNIGEDVTEGGEFIEYRASPHVVLRGLKQNKIDEEEPQSRCVVVWYQDPESNESNVVRGCTHESQNQEARCREAIGEGFTGILESCRVCNGDGCNAAGKSAAVILILVIGVVINIFVY